MHYITKEQIIEWLPIRDSHVYKNQLGHVLCVGGNRDTGGAIIMTAMAAVYAGAGLVTVATDTCNRSSLHTILPEAMFTDLRDMTWVRTLLPKVDVIVVGPGLGLDSNDRETLKQVLAQATKNQTIVADADALTLLSQRPQWLQQTEARVILTPHPGEWERISGQQPGISQDSDRLIQWVDELHATLVLKGSPTHVVTATDVWQNTTGNPAQATGGMGDTLAGVIASFVGQYPPSQWNEAILSGVFIHSYVADLLAEDSYVTLPTAIARALPHVMKQLANQKRT